MSRKPALFAVLCQSTLSLGLILGCSSKPAPTPTNQLGHTPGFFGPPEQDPRNAPANTGGLAKEMVKARPTKQAPAKPAKAKSAPVKPVT
jgi:hypothetical protein